MPATNVHPNSLDLFEITEDYPASEQQGSFWGKLKDMLGPSATKDGGPQRTGWFTIYEEPHKGFVIFEGAQIKRIILAETSHDIAEDLSRCRNLLLLLNEAHAILRQLDEREAAAFHERFRAEIWPICQREPASRRPMYFIQDVHNADARLVGIFYQTICLAYQAIDKIWAERDVTVEGLMHAHQDRVIRLWKERAAQQDVLVWKDLITQTLRFLDEARSAATIPELACQSKETVDDVQLHPGAPAAKEPGEEEDDVPSLDRLLLERNR